MKKRVLSLALALVLTAAITVPALSLTASASNVTTGQRFTDVSPDAWYYEAVTAMADAGIVNGVGDSRFEPTRPMTAGELATVLWNMTYGNWCKASEMYNNFDNGCNTGMSVDYSKPDYPGPRIGNWGIPKDGLHLWGGTPYSRIVPTTWDGPVALAIYGDSRLDPTCNNMANPVAATQINLTNGRAAGHPESPHDLPYGTLRYSRDMSGLAIVAMSKETVTRGFAISELVNVLRMTGYLKDIYNTSNNQAMYPTGAFIPDWADITNVYHDVCSASTKNAFNMGDVNYDRYHDYTWAWNYIDEPGKTVISGGYANTWFSADVLLAYQAGIVSGKDASGRCDVGASMTRAEVCQMLYNAGAGKTKFVPRNSRNGGGNVTGFFVRDGKIYEFDHNSFGDSIKCCGTYQPNSNMLAYVANDSTSYYDVYDTDKHIDIRQQEWPTHPEFWGN